MHPLKVGVKQKTSKAFLLQNLSSDFGKFMYVELNKKRHFDDENRLKVDENVKNITLPDTKDIH
jgi:hypothetical protein